MSRRYSLIIPTRNRQSTAIFAIISALGARFGNFEVIVTDNSDDDSLYAFLKDQNLISQIRYHKTERVLSMSENWERGIELSTGDVLSVIGDDDAIMPDAFTYADYIFNNFDIDVIHTNAAIYKWPSYPYYGRKNYFKFTLSDDVSIVKNPKAVLRDALNYKIRVGTGPGLYYGFVKKSFLKLLYQKRNAWIKDPNPDFDSGYCTLMYANAYATCERTLFIEGHSEKSNSGNIRLSSSYVNNIEIFAAENKLTANELLTEQLKNINSVNAIIISAQFRMIDEIRKSLNDDTLTVDLIGAWRYLLDGLKSGYDNINFLSSLPALERLATEWKIPIDEQSLSIKDTFSEGLLFEQGYSNSKTGSLNDQDNAKSFDTIVVNGKTAGLETIIDALNLLDSMLPSHIESPDKNLMNAIKTQYQKKFNQKIDAAKLNIIDQNLFDAEMSLSDVLNFDPENTEAQLLLVKIFFQQRRFAEICKILAMRFAKSKSLHDFFDLCDALILNDQDQLVEASLKGLLHNNEKIKDHPRFSAIEEAIEAKARQGSEK